MSRIVLAAIVVWSAPARAQPVEDVRASHGGYIGKESVVALEIDDCPSVPDVSFEELRRRGAEHYDRGEVLYAQGDYPNAVTELVASYCLFPTYYKLLKDIGQAYERSLDYEKAIAYLERYVAAIPKDAKRAAACDPDPQDDRRYVSFRIDTMRKLPARILVDTAPGDAKITLANDAGVAGRSTSGKRFGVLGGRYTMTIEREGHKTLTREVRAEIGKPYTFFERLEPVTGRLRIRVVPANARVFIDRRAVGTGGYETELPGGRYTITVEAEDRLTLSKDVIVLPERDTPVTIELAPVPQFGRRQLIAYATIAGGVAGAALLSNLDAKNQATYAGYGLAGGAIAGLAGTYWSLPNVPLGTSDLAITSSLVGGVAAGTTAAIFTNNLTSAAPFAGGGLVLGSLAGYYIGDRTHIRPGEAAVINSGALWGTVAGTLFVGAFQPTQHIGAGIALSGLGMGTTAGVLLSRYFTVSRAHAALIDVGGVVGMIVGVAAENLVYQTNGPTATPQSAQTEHVSNFALAGLGVGLITAAILTRNIDNTQVGIGPSIGAAKAPDGKSTATYGIGGSF